MSIVLPNPRSSLDVPARIPRLENGDQLPRVEFERRYAAMPDVKKAELIEGIVYMPSPVRFAQHGRPHALLVTWLGYYVSKTSGLLGMGDNATLRLDDDNEPQPDLLLRLPEALGGRSRITPDGFLEGPVEWIAEIAASSASLDMHRKLDVYRRHGVSEYLVWRVDEAALDWFILREGRYELTRPTEDGLLRSHIFPGLSLDIAALFRGDLPGLFGVIDAAARSAEHAAFVERLGKLPQ